MKIIEVSEELRVRAKQVLYLESAVQNVIRSLTEQIVKNHFDVVALWKDVKDEAERQGIVQEEDEMASFDYVTEKFMIVKRATIPDSVDVMPRSGLGPRRIAR